ncbi:MAG: hypothetical protein JXR96_23790 [Deltaproteobacteria bacterium]|nr:hypothetical protein [Deltaproteobacteria bacterium]
MDRVMRRAPGLACIVLSLSACLGCDSGGSPGSDAGLDGSDAGCQDACESEGALRCRGSWVQRCQSEEDGCLAWVDVEDCAQSDRTCQDGACRSDCEDECTTEYEQRCQGSWIQMCRRGDDGCLYWIDGVDCAATGRRCDPEAEPVECIDPCADSDCERAGASRCAGRLIRTCEADQDGCLHWTDGEDCGLTGRFCDGTADPVACVDECVSDCDAEYDRRCAGDWVQLCRLGEDGCLHWQDDQDCSLSRRTCVEDNGPAECVDICANLCSLDETRCKRAVIQRCEVDTNGCLDWVDVEDCAEQGLYCDWSGVCIDAPCQPIPPLRPYSGGECPVITSGPTSATSLNENFNSAGENRRFRFIVPESYDGSEPWPLVFVWHFMGSSSEAFIRDGELESAAEEMRMLFVVFDKLTFLFIPAYLFDWPIEPEGNSDEDREKELTFFDDVLTCVSEQYRIDPCQMHAAGGSAGALWLTWLSTTERVNYLASLVVLSGGLGEFGSQRLDYFPQPNKFPAVVLWGGEGDSFILNFAQASQRYRDELIADEHFVITCVHDLGHQIPPIQPGDGGTKFRCMWRFMLDHPFTLEAGSSPYQQDGLNSDFPEWCEIATP